MNRRLPGNKTEHTEWTGVASTDVNVGIDETSRSYRLAALALDTVLVEFGELPKDELQQYKDLLN